MPFVNLKTTKTHLTRATKAQIVAELLAYGSKPRPIAITFDDGPDPNFTPRILDILRDKNVKATFFLIGLPAQNNTGLLKRIYN